MTLKNQNPWKLLSIGLLGLIVIGIFTSSAFAISDWRNACSINSPLENLGCAVDHLEVQLNNLIDDVTGLVARVTTLEDANQNLQTRVNNLESRITSLEALHDGQEPPLSAYGFWTFEPVIEMSCTVNGNNFPLIVEQIEIADNGVDDGLDTLRINIAGAPQATQEFAIETFGQDFTYQDTNDFLSFEWIITFTSATQAISDLTMTGIGGTIQNVEILCDDLQTQGILTKNP